MADLQRVPQLNTSTKAHADVFNNVFKILEDNDFKNEENLKAYTDEQVQLITASGIPKLQSYRYSLTASANQTVFNIPLQTFSTDTDTVMIFRNTVLLEPSDYTVTDTQFTLTEAGNVGDTLALIILKHVPIGEDGSVHGKVIANNTISESKLDLPLQGKIDRKVNRFFWYNGEDLNTAKGGGIYAVLSGKNKPSGTAEIGVLFVNDYSPDWLVQEYYDIGNRQSYKRVFGGGTTWHEWVKDVTQSDLIANSELSTVKSNKDSEGIFTTVKTYRNANNSLYQESVLSGGTTPLYTTRTLNTYDVDGTTLLSTRTFNLTYDEDGVLVSEV